MSDRLPTIVSGLCHAVFAFDVGQSIDLEALERHIATLTQRERIRRTRRAPTHFAFDPPPLRMTMPAEPVSLGRFSTAATLSAVVYEFGAVSVVFNIAIDGPLADLQDLSVALYEDETLRQAAHRQAEALLEVLRAFTVQPRLLDLVEDYFIYEVRELSGGMKAAEVVQAHMPWIAQVLRSEAQPLSSQEVTEAVSSRIAYGADDLAIIDWNAALLFDPQADDVVSVLEFTNVELLELRFLDSKLDVVLDAAWKTLSEPRWPLFRTRAKEMRHLATLQVESAMLFEQVNNALKLFGDQYLARLYSTASQRMHIGDWDASILRKLETANGIYAKISDFQATRRMEILEWIIILLIALSIVIGFLPGLAK